MNYKIQRWFEETELPAQGTPAYRELSNEDKMIVSTITEMTNKPNGSLLNAIYTQLGEVVSEDVEYNATFGTDEE